MGSTSLTKTDPHEFVKTPLPEDLAKRDIGLTENARTVLKKRYLRRGPDGKPVETVEEMFWRVAYNVALAEKTLGGDEAQVEQWARKFYDLLTGLLFFPNSPTFTGAGTPLGQLAACFVLKIDDDMGRTGSGIFETLRHAALIQQTGGGNGFSFSRLRPKGSIVKTSNGTATGPIGFLRVYDQAFGEIAQGGCLTPDTLVFTEKGLLRLDEIVRHNEKGWLPHELRVSTDESPRMSYQGYNNGVAPVLRIKTEEGLSLTGTYNHKLKVMTANGPAWKRFDEIQPGDAILVKLGQHQGQIQSLLHPTRSHGNQVMPQFPAILDEELALFLGYLVGDGFVAAGEHDHRVGVTVAHTNYLMTEMPALMHRLFGDDIHIHTQQKANDASVTFVIDNRAVKDFMLMNGFGKARSSNVSVPRLIRQSPPEIVGAFLRGLFEADGAISRGYPHLLSTSKKLVDEVGTLLIGLGCPVRISQHTISENRYGKAPMWNLRIHSFIGLQNWQAMIGCDERSRFAVCYDLQPDLSREVSYVLPQANYWIEPVLEATRKPQLDGRGRGMGKNFRATSPTLRKQLLRYTRGDRQLTLSGYARLSEMYAEFRESARPVNDLWFVTVSEIEDAGEALTLDIEVEENHTYLANGLISHNSRRGANMAVLKVNHPDIRDFIKCKSTEGNIANFNISVGITDEFMRSVESGSTFDLVNPVDGKVWETVDARELFKMIVEYAHHNGEPGVLFLDAANRENPVPHLYELESTNPCVTGDTLIYTSDGIYRAEELFDDERNVDVVVDGRFGSENVTMPATRVFMTGTKQVYRLQTKEGYYLRATADHRVMTPQGWVELQNLNPGDKIHILNRKGKFGTIGSLELGRVLGWLVGDGTINKVRAVLSFFGEEKRELAPMFASYVDAMVTPFTIRPRTYTVGVTEIDERDEGRVQSERLRMIAAEYGLVESKHRVPESVFKGSEDMQRGFLQALFTADGSYQDGRGVHGSTVRLAANSPELLEGVQQLLLNFGIVSRIYRNRREAGYRRMPDGNGGLKSYWCEAQHELVISKRNLIGFSDDIGFLLTAKQQKLRDHVDTKRLALKREYFVVSVESITEDGIEDVFDLTEYVTHSFISNGIVVHNCGEQFLGPFENCCLGSVNLSQHITNDDQVDWEKLAESVATSTRFLDDVVTANAYVPAIPQLREAAENVRRIGLGIMGLGDMMYHLGIRYGSIEGQEFASQVMEFVRYHSMQTSIELAKERGPFLAIEGSRYDPNNLKWTAPKPIVEHKSDWGRTVVDWKKIEKGLKKYGIRNGAQLTVAPTGTIATVAGCEAYGCEPVFALAYLRYVNENAGNTDAKITLQYTSPLFEKALRKAGLDQATIDKIVAQVNETGSCQNIPEVPENIRRVFVTAGDITAEEHVRMQAAMQAQVDNAISKCVTGDTLVLTTSGLIPIEELSQLRQPDEFEPMQVAVNTPRGIEYTDAFYYGGMRETRKVILAYGYEVEGTPNHRIQVLTSEGCIEFARLDEIKIGDTVVLYSGQQAFGVSAHELPRYTGEFNTNSKTVTFPQHMSPELAYVLGCITSEGSIGENSVQICNGDYALLQRLGIHFQNLFGLNSHITRDNRRESVYSLQINSRPLIAWLTNSLGMKAGARNKIIPTCILQSSREEIAAFLRGLFLDAYMIQNGRMFGIGLASQKLIKQLQTLLLNFGIFSRIHKSSNDAWALTVAGKALEALSTFISFDESWKNERIARREESRKQHQFNFATLLPETVTESLRRMQTSSDKSLRGLYGVENKAYQRARVNLLNGHRMDRETATAVYEHFDDSTDGYAHEFFANDQPNCIYVKVEAITDGFAEVFDLSVPGSHSFIANGIGNHNTCNFPAGATEDDVAEAYMLAWKLGCKGLTVYVTGSREVVVLETAETKKKKEGGQSETPVAAPATPVAPQPLPLFNEDKKPRPSNLEGKTYRMPTPAGTSYITINENGEGHGQPFEVFIHTSKAGSEIAAVSEAIGRLISLVLRLASPVSPRNRVKQIVRQLGGIGGGRQLGIGPNKVISLPDAVSQVLQQYLDDTAEADNLPQIPRKATQQMALLPAENGNGTAEEKSHMEYMPIGDICPECGTSTLMREEGCLHCYTCGYSEC